MQDIEKINGGLKNVQNRIKAVNVRRYAEGQHFNAVKRYF